MENSLTNKVQDSQIITIDLESYYPKDLAIVFDLKEYLFMGLILKEKDFREALKNLDLSCYNKKNIALMCSTDAIIPMWAYMLVVTYLQPIANNIVFGNLEYLNKKLILDNIEKINPQDFLDKRVVIKGCGDLPISESAYVAITNLLMPVAKSIMYGEPCSTVPIYKKK